MLHMVETLHAVGLIHGDFKPDNLLIRYARYIKLLLQFMLISLKQTSCMYNQKYFKTFFFFSSYTFVPFLHSLVCLYLASCN